MKLIGWLLELISYASDDGAWSIAPLHRDIIESVLDTLDNKTASTVREQLNKRYFVQWMAYGRVNRIFFKDVARLRAIEDPSFANKLFKTEFFIDGKKHVAHVIFYEGRIFGVEMKVPRKFYKNREYRVGRVTEGKASDSFTAVIDRVAHGKETGTNP